MQSNYRAERSLGYRQIAAGGADTATAVNPPVGTALILIIPEAQAIRWRDDGTAPTATVGQPLAVGTELRYTAANGPDLKVIAQTAGAIVNLYFYA